ncbi:hypothetical protein PoB_006290100 [Plakobranchus ocellatus]|uniref:Uncharacterized protein n=1 Tax=Plakobranchus ocellatus TaxID=259542 RepID=A0AAV4CX03_9GAST|nr:hypothetical protein PoB_006290100 [Plakobranchus ocellatus]
MVFHAAGSEAMNSDICSPLGGSTYDRKSAMTSSLTRYKSSSYSDIIEKLMTPHPTRTIRDIPRGNASDDFYAATNQRRDVTGGQDSDGQSHFIDALTQTTCEVRRSSPRANVYNPGFDEKSTGSLSLVDSSQGAGVSSQTTPLPAYSAYSHTSLPNTGSNVYTSNYDDAMKEMRNLQTDAERGRPGNIITEMTSAYKRRVVEETEETTTM